MPEDLIKRSDAIKALIEWYGCKPDDIEAFEKIIEAIPFADNDVIGKLKTAIENEEICKNCPTAERISGENLLGAMALGFSYGMEADRPQGKWIVNVSDYKSVCPVCGAKETEFIYGTEMWYGLGESKFCPNCGARMKGADDE